MVDAITAPDVLHLFIGAVISYLLGSLNGSLLLSKLILKDDIRRHGSGNAGATNVLRTYGKGWTVLVSLWDMGKGALAVALGWGLGLWIGGRDIGMIAAGFCVILGHVFPVFFKFKGGKGVATACAVLFALDWRVAAIALSLFLHDVSKSVQRRGALRSWPVDCLQSLSLAAQSPSVSPPGASG